MFPADLESLAEGITRPDDGARADARAALRELAADDPRTRAGSHGRLGDLAVWLSGVTGSCPPNAPRRPLLVLLADDPFGRPEVDRVVAADVHPGLRLRTLTATAGPTPDTTEAVLAALDRGSALADAEADAGTDLLLVAAPAAAVVVPSLVLVAALTGNDAPSVVGSEGLDDSTWMRTCAAVRDGLRRARPAAGDPVDLLAAVGGADVAVLAGLLLRAAARRTPVVLDGSAVLAAGLLAQRGAPDASDWWLVAHRDADPATAEALRNLGLVPVLDLGLRSRDGLAAALTVPLIAAAAALLADPRGTDDMSGSSPRGTSGDGPRGTDDT